MFIVTENCTGDDLLTWISEDRLLDAAAQKRVFNEICLGVQYLHGRGIAHNDIKPENVIMDAAGHAKLIDFGYAKPDRIAGDQDKSGTLNYAAPELFRRGTYHTQKADIWSLGILLYAMTTGRFPFVGTDDRKIVSQILRGNLKFQEDLDPDVEALVRRLTKLNPNERPTIDEVLEDPYFSTIDEEPVKHVIMPAGAAEISAEKAIEVEAW
jgi:serine/threonine protein kinase